MWTEQQLVDDLQELGLREGLSVLAHTSLRAIGDIEGGAATLLNAFLRVLGKEGTLLVPTFTSAHRDPLERSFLRAATEEDELYRAAMPRFDLEKSPADTHSVGIFPEIVRQHPDARRSSHPGLSFAAIGAKAEFFTHATPFHYPLGSESPLARLHQINGYVLLIGVDHTVNTSLHLAEVWADVPYIHRSAKIKTDEDTWALMQGSPECSLGFGKIEALLRQSRIPREGYIGNARSQLMPQRQLISMGVALLQGERSFLLCDDLHCSWCTLARKLNADTSPNTSMMFSEF